MKGQIKYLESYILYPFIKVNHADDFAHPTSAFHDKIAYLINVVNVACILIISADIIVIKVNTYTARPVCWREWIS